MRTGRGLTLLEVVVVIAMIGILTALILPTMRRRESGGRRTQCASNVRQILTAMYLYSDAPSNVARMPTLAPSKADPFAQTQPGSEGLSLLYKQYINDPRIFACPTDPRKPSPQRLQNIRGWLPGETAANSHMTPADTSYGYDPGHSTEISSMVALLSDKPGKNGNSDNHGPHAGQNVGFGTSVEFRETSKNPLGEGAADNNIFTLGDTTPGTSGPITRDEDSYIRP